MMKMRTCLCLVVAMTAACHSSGVARQEGGREPDTSRPVVSVGSEFDRPGFATKVVDGRLWVFRLGSKELETFLTYGELAKHVVRPREGPNGMTVKAPDEPTAIEYLTWREGYATRFDHGRIWVFRSGSKELEDFLRDGDLAKHISRPKAGPFGMTVKAPDTETAVGYLCSKEGFYSKLEEGRLWVFRLGSKELEAYQKYGELAKYIVLPKGGPMGLTIKAPDEISLLSYMCARDGFVTRIEGSRLWVFRPGSKELSAFERDGDLAKHVVRPRAGPGGITIKAPDAETIDAYLAAGGVRLFDQ